MRTYLVDGQIRSKAAGGRYGLAHFDHNCCNVIDWALAQYTGVNFAGNVPGKAELERFANASIAVIGAEVG